MTTTEVEAKFKLFTVMKSAVLGNLHQGIFKKPVYKTELLSCKYSMNLSVWG